MQAHHVMRIELQELYRYLNAKRDTEIATFRHALFSALHTKTNAPTNANKKYTTFAFLLILGVVGNVSSSVSLLVMM